MSKKQLNRVSTLIPNEAIENKIFMIAGKKVMLDRDLAHLYGVTTGNLNKAVKRNSDRFPNDFMFQLNIEEAKSSRFQIGSLKKGSNIKYLPYAFTQEGVAMLSSVLKSSQAVQVNIQIIRIFVKLRELMISHKDLARKIENMERKFKQHDKNFIAIFQALKKLLDEPAKPKNPIGFHVK